MKDCKSKLYFLKKEIAVDIKEVGKIKDPSQIPSAADLRANRKHFMDVQEVQQEIAKLKAELDKFKNSKKKNY